MGSYEGIFRTCAYIKIKRQYTTQDISTTGKIKSTPRSIDPFLLSTDTEHSAAFRMSISSSSSTNHELTDLEASQPKQTAVNFLPAHLSEYDREDDQANHRGSRPLASLLQGLTLIPDMETLNRQRAERECTRASHDPFRIVAWTILFGFILSEFALEIWSIDSHGTQYIFIPDNDFAARLAMFFVFAGFCSMWTEPFRCMTGASGSAFVSAAVTFINLGLMSLCAAFMTSSTKKL